MVTTFRSDIADGILSVLNTFITVHPDRLVRAYRARPENVTVDLPAAFIDARPESITHSQQIRTRILSPSVVVIRAYTDNPEAMAAFDVLVDLLVDAFSAAPQFATGTIWDEFTIADEEYAIGDYLYPAVRFTFGDVSIMEGRP